MSGKKGKRRGRKNESKARGGHGSRGGDVGLAGTPLVARVVAAGLRTAIVPTARSPLSVRPALLCCPTDLHQRGLLPGVLVSVCVPGSDTSVRVGVGHVWPARKLARGQVQLSTHLLAAVQHAYERTGRSGAAKAEGGLAVELLALPADGVHAAEAVVATPQRADDMRELPSHMTRALVAHAIVGRVFCNGATVAARVGGRVHRFQLRCTCPGCAVERAPTRGDGASVPTTPGGDDAPLRASGGAGSGSPTPFVVGDDTRILVGAVGLGESDGGGQASSRTAAQARAGAAPATDDPFAAVGGLDAELAAIRRVLETPLTRPELFTDLGIPPPRGVLLFGPPGTGKTLIAKAFAASYGASMFVINGPEVMSKYVGESEQRIRDVFSAARAAAPAVIFIDEVDAVCPARDSTGVSGEVGSRVVATLLAAMDGASESARSAPVVVLAATNRPNALDPALRRPGRLDREVEIGIPSEAGRLHILTVTMRRYPHCMTQADFAKVAGVTHGFVGADLTALCAEAALLALGRAAKRRRGAEARTSFESAGAAPAAPAPAVGEATVAAGAGAGAGAGADDTAGAQAATAPRRVEGAPSVAAADLQAALKVVRPSALREVEVDVPSVRWSDIGGNDDVKQALKEAVEWPLRHPDAFARMGIQPPKGVLMYGPPGCSKTMMAKALATEGGMNFVAVKGPELFTKWVGESEKAVREVFRKARAAAPTVVFFDEIDALAGSRQSGDGASGVTARVLSQLLHEMDGIEPLRKVVVVAATNRPDLLDRALLRPGRIDRIMYVGPPDQASREAIVKLQLRRIPHDPVPALEPSALATALAGLSGAEIVSVFREAALCAMEEDVNATRVLARHVDAARARVVPQITAEMTAFYARFRSSATSR